MGLIPKFYMESVVSIGIRSASGINWIGTGFFVIKKIKDEDAYHPFMVTNRHVIENLEAIVIRLMIFLIPQLCWGERNKQKRRG